MPEAASTPVATAKPQPGIGLPYLALATVSLMWGASFLFIKVAIRDMSPEVLVLIRAGSAAAALGLILAASRRSPFPPDFRKRLPAFAVMAIAYSVIPWTLISWGELYISSGLASILNATVPLFTALIAHWATPGERPTLLNLAGVLVGFAGTVILVAPELTRRGLMSGNALGAVAVLIAALSYAAASLYQRRRLAGANVFVATFWQVTLAAGVMLPLSAPTLSATHLQAVSLGAALALGVGATGAGLAIYYYLLNPRRHPGGHHQLPAPGHSRVLGGDPSA